MRAKNRDRQQRGVASPLPRVMTPEGGDYRVENKTLLITREHPRQRLPEKPYMRGAIYFLCAT